MLSPSLIKAIVVVVLLAALAWAVNAFLDYQQGIGYDRRTAEYLVQENADLKAAKAESARLQLLVQEAQLERAKYEEENRKLSARNGILLGQLRQRSTNIDSLVSGASHEALQTAARTLNTLFTACRGEFEEVGRAAAGHRADAETLDRAWPEGVK